MKNFALCLILFFSISVLAEPVKPAAAGSVQAPAHAEDQTAPDPEHKTNGDELLGKATAFRKEILRKINEIIAEVENNYPTAITRYDSDDEEKILKALVSALNSGIEYLSPETASSTQDDVKKDSAPCPAIIISSQKVLYTRIDEFNPATFAKFKDDCGSSARLANRPVGLIIDIRDCQGYDYESCIRTLALFCPPEKVPRAENIEIPKRTLNIPVIMLVGNKTKGAAEIFARLMLENGQCLISGSGTAGYPFFKKKTVLKSGSCLLIPSVPKFLSKIPASQVVPTINIAAYPQLAYEKLSGAAGSEESDKCLQRAIDLLISLDAIHKDRKNRVNEKTKSK
ncbi:MAG: S41 family peptidase [Victivallales bacterium]|jgi:C-terminal processing protease CtpA/Prc